MGLSSKLFLLSADETVHALPNERHTYFPSIDLLRGLRHEGFERFMVAQGRSRIDGTTEVSKHLIRVRHMDTVSSKQGRGQ